MGCCKIVTWILFLPIVNFALGARAAVRESWVSRVSRFEPAELFTTEPRITNRSPLSLGALTNFRNFLVAAVM